MSYYRPVFKDDNLNEIASADYIATEYVYNRQSLNDLTHGFPVLVNPKVSKMLQIICCLNCSHNSRF